MRTVHTTKSPLGPFVRYVWENSLAGSFVRLVSRVGWISLNPLPPQVQLLRAIDPIRHIDKKGNVKPGALQDEGLSVDLARFSSHAVLLSRAGRGQEWGIAALTVQEVRSVAPPEGRKRAPADRDFADAHHKPVSEPKEEFNYAHSEIVSTTRPDGMLTGGQAKKLLESLRYLKKAKGQS